MAKKQQDINLISTEEQTTENIPTNIEQLKDSSEEKIRTIEDRLSELKKAFKGKSISDFKVVIYYNDQFLETVPAVDVNFESIEEWLKNKYGGGTYSVEVRKNGAIFIHRNYMRFNIIGEPKFAKSNKDSSSTDPVYSLLGDTLSKVVNKIEQLENKVSGNNNDNNYMISFMQLMMEQNKANQQMMLELMKLNQNQPQREKSFIEKLFEGLTLDKVMVIAPTVLPAVKEFFSNISGGNGLKAILPALEKNPDLLEKVIAKELGIDRKGNVLDIVLSNPELLGKTLEVVNSVLAGRQPLNPPTSPPATAVHSHSLPPTETVEPSIEGSTLLKPEKKIQSNPTGEDEMIKMIVTNQINNVLQKLMAIKEGMNNGEFENIAVAVDYVFAPAEIDTFLGYMEQFNINTADDLIKTLNKFRIDLNQEINKIGKDLLNDVIKYLNSEEDTPEGKNE